MWYAYTTEPQKELKAQEILTRLGFRVALPVETKKRRVSRHAKKTITYKKPLLVGYIFVDIPPHIPWSDPLYYYVCRTIVGVDCEPVAIDGEAIERLLDVANVEHVEPVCRFKQGDSVKMMSGPLMGLPMRVHRVRGKEATALFKMLGCDREVFINLDNVVAA